MRIFFEMNNLKPYLNTRPLLEKGISEGRKRAVLHDVFDMLLDSDNENDMLEEWQIEDGPERFIKLVENIKAATSLRSAKFD